MAKKLLSIKELSTLLKVKPQTLRFYEQEGLIDKPLRTGSNYRKYSPEIVRQVRFVIAAKELGFSLKEVAAFFAERRAASRGSRCAVSVEFAEKKLKAMEMKIRDLQASRRRLATAMKQDGWVSKILQD